MGFWTYTRGRIWGGYIIWPTADGKVCCALLTTAPYHDVLAPNVDTVLLTMNVGDTPVLLEEWMQLTIGKTADTRNSFTTSVYIQSSYRDFRPTQWDLLRCFS